MTETAPFSVAFGEGVSFGANFVYNCNDELAFTGPEEVAALIDEAEVRPELATGEFSGTYSAFEVCDVLDLAAPALRENRPVESDVPERSAATSRTPARSRTPSCGASRSPRRVVAGCRRTPVAWPGGSTSR